MIGTIIIWFVVIWMVAGTWGGYQILNNKGCREYFHDEFNEVVRQGVLDPEQEKWVLVGVFLGSIILGFFSAKRAFTLKDKSEEDFVKLMSRK